MQDRLRPDRRKPLATRGRTIHLGQTEKNSLRAYVFRFAPQTRTSLDAFGMSQRCQATSSGVETALTERPKRKPPLRRLARPPAKLAGALHRRLGLRPSPRGSAS